MKVDSTTYKCGRVQPPTSPERTVLWDRRGKEAFLVHNYAPAAIVPTSFLVEFRDNCLSFDLAAKTGLSFNVTITWDTKTILWIAPSHGVHEKYGQRHRGEYDRGVAKDSGGRKEEEEEERRPRFLSSPLPIFLTSAW
ncbi:hypothetical protein RJZ90_005190 [Blastomyces dermatitidis]